MGLQLRGSVLGGLPASSVLPIPHPRPMGQLWGCRQAAAVGWGTGVGLQFLPLHSDSVLGGTEGAPLLLLSAAYRIHVPWGSCRTAGRQQLQAGGQVWGCSPPLHSEAHCWGALRGLPSFSSVFCTSSVSCETAGGQLWGCSSGARCWGGSPPLQCSPYLIRVPWGSCGAAGRRQLWAGGQVWGCSFSPCTQTQCWGALRGLPSFSSVLHTASMSHGAAAGLQAGSSCRLGGRCGAAAPRCTQGLIVGAH